jgi:tetratricopeptide (TPR) repeat protein
MMPKRWLGVCVLSAGLVLGSSMISSLVINGQRALAQDVIDLDEDDEEVDPNAPAPGAAVTAGTMSEGARAAKALFDQQKWPEAALALFGVVAGETGDDDGNKQLAQYFLSISLYRMKLYQASYALFGYIADNRNHLKFNETLLWLAKLATQLPEPADIIERVGRYRDTEIASFNNDKQKELYYQLNYLLGRYKYRNRQFEEAIRLFNKVDDDSQYYIHAQFFAGTSYVQLKKSVPAVQAFQRIESAADDGVEGLEDEGRIRDLAFLSMARTYYSASIRLTPETNTPTVDEKKLSAAVKHWNQIEPSSEYWLDALFEESWAYFMAGQYPKALGNIHTIQSPYFPGAFYPEAEILKAVIYFSNCNYDAATTVVARFNKRFVPIQEELQKVLARFKGEQQTEPFFKFLLSVRDGTADLPPSISGIVEASMSDRQLLRGIEYVRVLDEEMARFQQTPGSFKSSGLGTQVSEVLKIARDLAVTDAGELARQRYQRNLEELDEHLRNGEKILIDITAAQRNELDQAIAANQVSQQESKIFGKVSPDDEHMLWPFDGEYWRDELGFYRQVVESACGR